MTRHKIIVCIFTFFLQINLNGSLPLQLHIGVSQAVGTSYWYFTQQDFVYHNQQDYFLNLLKGDTQSTDDGYIAGIFHGFSYEPGSDNNRFDDFKNQKGLFVAKTVHELFLSYFRDNPINFNGGQDDDSIQRMRMNTLRILYNAFAKVNEQLKNKLHSQIINNGTTATIAYRTGNWLYIANVGHNRAVWGQNCNDQTEDHTLKSEKERKRFKENTAFKKCGDVVRLDGDLLITRVFGYTKILKYINPIHAIDPVPAITVIDLEEHATIIIGTHALWGGVSEKASKKAFQTNDNRFAYKLMQQSLANGSIDNACLVLIAAAICFSQKELERCTNLVKELALKNHINKQRASLEELKQLENARDSLQFKQCASKKELKEELKGLLKGLNIEKVKHFVEQNKYNLDDNTSVIILHAHHNEPSSIMNKEKIDYQSLFVTCLLLYVIVVIRCVLCYQYEK